MGLFDHFQRTAVNVVSKTMGDNSIWQPLAGGEPQSANVLFKDATQTAKLLDQPFDPKLHLAEYQEGDFVGLFEAVDSGSEEKITVNGKNYGVLEVTSKFDGKTYIAALTLLK